MKVRAFNTTAQALMQTDAQVSRTRLKTSLSLRRVGDTALETDLGASAS